METKRIEKYVDKTDMNQFKHVKEISDYNFNYYLGFDKDLLYAHSDDDNTTEWFIINGEYEPIYIGYSLVNDNDILNKTEHRCT